MNSATQAVLDYHQRTKHQTIAYARGPDTLDWDDQPNPFRRFAGCELINLPTPGAEVDCRFSELDSPQNIAARALDLPNIGLLFELAFGLSAWKQYGPDRWALRCNPSSGNLHPTEAYLLCSDAALLTPGVYHYVSHDHALERRCRYATPSDQSAVYIGLSSIHWREAWKYGERAFRYCQHDIGHALAALSYAAASLGWRLELLSETADSDLAHWLGLDRSGDFIANEPENPDLLCRLHYTSTSETGVCDLAALSAQAQWFGKAQVLSQYHIFRWPIIEQVASQCHKPATAVERWTAEWYALKPPSHDLIASQLIRQRRSAQRFNPKAAPLALNDFLRLLSALQANAKPPFTAWNWPPQVHLLLFIHRVEGLEPGLYLLPRTPEAASELQQACAAEFSWQEMDLDIELYQLIPGNVQQAAKNLSCHQAIASDSAFSLGMIAEFAGPIQAQPWHYRRLFWECGLLGQILYLEAEAAGVRGTGIGCFFDDLVHGVLGLKDNHWQSLYHFTVGTPLDDNRLQTLPPYAHLKTD